MNYLAHAFLSPEDPYTTMGNLWGDLLRPKDFDGLHPGILKGVKRHRRIDAFTDAHPAVDNMLEILRPSQGKYAPVVTDVIMDYMLSLKWKAYTTESLESFCASRYATVSIYLRFLPERLHPRINNMLDHRWLESCKNRTRMVQTLQMLSKRASFDNAIPDALIPYEENETEMNGLFDVFFADIRNVISLQNED